MKTCVLNRDISIFTWVINFSDDIAILNYKNPGKTFYVQDLGLVELS